VLEKGKNLQITFTLIKVPGSKDWHEFRISMSEGDVVSEHCHGLARMCQREWGNDFGPTFQRLIKFEAVSGQRFNRSLMSLSPPESKHSPQSYYLANTSTYDSESNQLIVRMTGLN
jgi:hypothetical protein